MQNNINRILAPWSTDFPTVLDSLASYQAGSLSLGSTIDGNCQQYSKHIGWIPQKNSVMAKESKYLEQWYEQPTSQGEAIYFMGNISSHSLWH